MTNANAGEPIERLLHWREVKAQTGLSRTTAWRLQHQGAFPAPIYLSQRRVAWRSSELEAWKQGRGREPPEPSARPSRRKAEAASSVEPAVAPRIAFVALPVEDVPDIAPARSASTDAAALTAQTEPGVPSRPRRATRSRVSPDQLAFDF